MQRLVLRWPMLDMAHRGGVGNFDQLLGTPIDPVFGGLKPVQKLEAAMAVKRMHSLAWMLSQRILGIGLGGQQGPGRRKRKRMEMEEEEKKMDGQGGQGGAEEEDFACGNKRILPVPPLITQPSAFDTVLESLKGSAGSGTGLGSLGLRVSRTVGPEEAQGGRREITSPDSTLGMNLDQTGSDMGCISGQSAHEIGDNPVLMDGRGVNVNVNTNSSSKRRRLMHVSAPHTAARGTNVLTGRGGRGFKPSSTTFSANINANPAAFARGWKRSISQTNFASKGSLKKKQKMATVDQRTQALTQSLQGNVVDNGTNVGRLLSEMEQGVTHETDSE